MGGWNVFDFVGWVLLFEVGKRLLILGEGLEFRRKDSGLEGVCLGYAVNSFSCIVIIVVFSI